MHEQDITFESDGLTLAGTLALPDGDGRVPGVVLVVGSGKVDRNENAGRVRMNVFNELARRLAERGIASLRYDKRGVGASGGEFLTAGFHDNVTDAGSAFRRLREHERIDASRVFVVGHSEGAVIAARLAGEGLPAAGFVLLAGTAQSGERVLQWQATEVIKHLAGFQGWLIRTLRVDPLKTQRKLLDKVTASAKDVLRVQLIVRINAKWMREFIAYDPAADLARAGFPVLAITGEYDIQVDPADVVRMKEIVTSPFEGHVVPGVSHILRAGKPGLADYKRQMKEPLDTRVVSLLTDWLEARRG